VLTIFPGNLHAHTEYVAQVESVFVRARNISVSGKVQDELAVHEICASHFEDCIFDQARVHYYEVESSTIYMSDYSASLGKT